jgi:large subunit ribosomal protein L19
MKAKKYTRETIREMGMENRNFPAFDVGDTIAVHQRIKEGDKERIQIFEGDVIAKKHGNCISSTFTVRKIGAHSVPVERVFPYFSPRIDSIKFIRKGVARRAKLYYLRNRVGKAARVQELIVTKQERESAGGTTTQVQE